MRLLPFKKSSAVSIGVELEFQIVAPRTYSLVSRAKDLIRNLRESPHRPRITPEITQSMIEINSSIHHSPQAMLEELVHLQQFLLGQAAEMHIAICGGGTHPFQRWTMQKIFPTIRYRKLSRKYRYLSKRSTVFGQHIHIGCTQAEDALYLTHALARYVPQFIAICASSPFYQGIDTGYCSSRSTIFNAFPLSGVIPYLINWREFSDYYYKMRQLGIIASMKDFYWDIRPKPEFGTVEIRVCDTPLTIKKAVLIIAYIQALSLYLLEERPIDVSHDLYYLYNHNRFQASRYGFEGDFINPYTMQHSLIIDDLIETVKKIENYIVQLGNSDYVALLVNDAMKNMNDAAFLKQVFKQEGSLSKVVAAQCRMWAESI
ncbi:carboxylate-amine ligase [Legionella donaldsonii]|uniref:Putative glutamate--cysteine ligase 2 n=1 Tax=Legionella donaldsonii TaxID=45060 RepID=A0A378J4A2_9GAMM|nr:YbdK family carboxylate-amine ligase [Legionella donaldsonii]STX42465.1 carboxylate-amine ligase [Legionella donaldsonii]